MNLVDKFGSTYPEDTVVFREGDIGEEMYIIHQGEVKILKKAKNAEQVLAVLKDGDFFGEMALFTDKVRSATATVTVKSRIIKLDRNSFEFMLKHEATFALNLIKTLCERLKRTDERIEELLVFGKETRVMKALEEFWRNEGFKDSSGAQLLVPFEPFLEYSRANLGINSGDCKAVLYDLKNRDLVHVRKDTNGRIFLTFSPDIFGYLEVI